MRKMYVCVSTIFAFIQIDKLQTRINSLKFKIVKNVEIHKTDTKRTKAQLLFRVYK